MDTFQLILNLIGVVLFLGAVAIFLRGSADKGTIDSLQKSVAALKVENELHEEKITAQTTRLDGLEKENSTLREFVTQKREVANLTVMLENHHTESMAALKTISEKVSA